MAIDTTFNLENISDSFIDSYTKEFIQKNVDIINSIAYKLYKDNSKTAASAFQEIVHEELKKACYSFVNNNHEVKYIDSYLFSCIKKTVKSINNEGKKSVYVCPCCKHFGKITILGFSSQNLSCNVCKNALLNSKEEWENKLYQTYAEHPRKGFRCGDCDEFIPDTLGINISCPYPNCLFVGNRESTKIMKHPIIKTIIDNPMYKASNGNQDALTYKTFSDSLTSEHELTFQNDITEYESVLKEVIDTQINLLHYKCNASTLVNKLCMYQSYKNMIEKYPNDMISYLVFLNRNVRMQHKIFQEFVRLLEEKIPFSFQRNGKIFEVKSLLDNNLCVFSGESEFTSVVEDNFEIQNMTTELYVGGRKGSYCRPFYIGKILEVFDIDNNVNITPCIEEYTFFKLHMKDVKPGTNVRVKHLRIPPHYQMGGMVYVNRIRRAIVDKVYFTLNGKKRVIK